MDADEEFARKLQQQFDKEAAAAETLERLDTELAQRIARESHQLSDSEDEETYCSSQEIAPIDNHQTILKNLEKNSNGWDRSPTKCVENSGGCSSSPTFSMSMNKTKSFSKESGSSLKVGTTKNSYKKETQSPRKGKSSSAVDQKNSTISSMSDTTLKEKHCLHQSFENLSALRERKVPRDAASCTLNEDKHMKMSKRKSVDTESPASKLEKSPSFYARKSLHNTESTNLKKNKSTFTNSSPSKSSIVKSLSDPGSSCSKALSLDKQDNSSSNDIRPLCKYGAGCYRTNPIHLKEFRHSEDPDTGVRKKEIQEVDLIIRKAKSAAEREKSNEKNVDMKLDLLTAKKSPNKEPIANDSKSSLKRPSNQNSGNEPLLKKKKSGESSMSTEDKSKGFAARLAASDPYRLFLTKSFSVPASHSDPLGCVLPDLLNRSLGTVVETVQFSFVVDLDFVFESYKACGLEDKPLLLLYGEMEGDTTQFTKGTFVKVSMPFLYGTHHTKLMLLLYTEGLRVVVHTANLRADDWYEKTQGVWVSPLFPKLDIRPAPPGCPTPGDSPTLFRQDLLQYLQSYKLAPLAHWADIVRRHDFAQCNAVFVGHVPGYHAGPALPLYGQLKLRRALGRHTSKDKWRGAEALKGSTTVVQCSSIGSLGKDATWLSQDLGASLSGGQSCPASKVVVMYPSEEDVRLSSQGWMGGSCLPYQSGTHAKQPWLVKHLHHWRSDRRHRTRAMPHIKTYTRLLRSTASEPLSTSGCEAQYLLLTSANLSKAAWGQAQKQGAQLFIRSYEAGVLLLPKFVTGEESFPLSAPRPLTLPYDLPPTPYTSSDRPWLMDTNKKNKDVNGDTYP